MVVSSLLDRLRGGDARNRDETSTEEPTHVCQSCGEKYVTREGTEIATCHTCGGVRVEPV